MRGRPVVPERDVARIPFEAHRVFGAHNMLPQDLQYLGALPRSETDEGLQEGRAGEQHPLPGLRVDRHQRMLAFQSAAFDALLYSLPALASARGSKA